MAAANAMPSAFAFTSMARNEPITKRQSPSMKAYRPVIVSISPPPISRPVIPPIANRLIVHAASEASMPEPRACRIQCAMKKKSGYWQVIPATTISQ